MRRREMFLKEAIAAHLAFEASRETLCQLSREGRGESSEWLEAFARQQQALAVWSSLPRKYGDFDADDPAAKRPKSPL